MLSPYTQPVIDEATVRSIRCLVRIAIRKGWFHRDQFEDLVQDAIVHLLQKIGGFDPSKACWSTFCGMVVRHFLSRLRSGRCNCFESFDDDFQSPQAAGQIDESQSVSRRFTRYRSEHEQVEFQEDVAYVVNQLPAELRDICEHFQINPRVSHVAEQLGVSRQTIYRRKEQVKQWFVCESLSEYR